MTHEEAMTLLEEVLNKYLPINVSNKRVEARDAIRGAALVCSFPSQYDKADARTRLRLEPANV